MFGIFIVDVARAYVMASRVEKNKNSQSVH